MAVAVSRVKRENVNAGFGKSRSAVKNVACGTESRTAEKSAARIPCGIRVLNALFNILNGDKSL